MARPTSVEGDPLVQMPAKEVAGGGETQLQHMLNRLTWWNGLLSSLMLRNRLLSSL